jgi:hydroxymethylbilane synthase
VTAAAPVLTIATRRSALARAQATQVGQSIRAVTGVDFALLPLATTGDTEPERRIAAFDTKGLFVDTIRTAVLSGEADLAVHSYKDLPLDVVDGLAIGAVPSRADARDLLVTRDPAVLSSLARGATVGTSSARRRLQLLRARPDLQVLDVRGNLDTRLRKVAGGEYDAVVVAMAGLSRLYVDPARGGVGALDLPLHAAPLEPGECLPAAAQGALALECRADDETTLRTLARIDDPRTRVAVAAERAFLDEVGGGCLAPVGAFATVAGGVVELAGMIGDPGRRRMLRQTVSGSARQPRRVAQDLAERMRQMGGDELMRAVGVASPQTRKPLARDEAEGQP